MGALPFPAPAHPHCWLLCCLAGGCRACLRCLGACGEGGLGGVGSGKGEKEEEERRVGGNRPAPKAPSPPFVFFFPACFFPLV